MKLSFNVDQIVNATNQELLDGVNESLDIIKTSVDAKTPEDTKRLLGNNKIIKASLSSGGVVGRLINYTPYAIYVEYGVRGKEYNYNKPKGNIFYKGIGARMFTRGLDDSLNKINNILKGLSNR